MGEVPYQALPLLRFFAYKIHAREKVRKGEGEPGDEANPATLARNSEPRPLPVWAGRASASIAFENHRFMPHFGGSPFETGGLPELLTLDL